MGSDLWRAGECTHCSVCVCVGGGGGGVQQRTISGARSVLQIVLRCFVWPSACGGGDPKTSYWSNNPQNHEVRNVSDYHACISVCARAKRHHWRTAMASSTLVATFRAEKKAGCRKRSGSSWYRSYRLCLFNKHRHAWQPSMLETSKPWRRRSGPCRLSHTIPVLRLAADLLHRGSLGLWRAPDDLVPLW